MAFRAEASFPAGGSSARSRRASAAREGMRRAMGPGKAGATARDASSVSALPGAGKWLGSVVVMGQVREEDSGQALRWKRMNSHQIAMATF